MQTGIRLPLLCALPIALAGCGPAGDATPPADADASPGVPPAASPGGEETTAAGQKPAAFAMCATCHSIEPGKNGIGPSLVGVFGRPAAGVSGFAYSQALKNSGLVWDEATLDRWLAGPSRVVPGNRMSFSGMPNAQARKQVIDYLATMK